MSEIKTEINEISLPKQEIPKEQQELLNALNELLISTQELSFAVALVPQEITEKFPEIKDLIESAKNVVRSTYKLHKLVKVKNK